VEEWPSVPLGGSGPQIRGRYVDCNGNTATQDPMFWITQTVPHSQLPRVASNGTASFVVYEELDSANPAHVYLRKVTGTSAGSAVQLD
jgi:hypothetical protein